LKFVQVSVSYKDLNPQTGAPSRLIKAHQKFRNNYLFYPLQATLKDIQIQNGTLQKQVSELQSVRSNTEKKIIQIDVSYIQILSKLSPKNVNCSYLTILTNYIINHKFVTNRYSWRRLNKIRIR
jgi:hypothetical protein